jgi:hypothetical protein
MNEPAVSDDPRAVAARKLDVARARRLWHASFVVLIVGTLLSVTLHPAPGGAHAIGRLTASIGAVIGFLGWIGTNTPFRWIRWLACGAAMLFAFVASGVSFLIALVGPT